MPSPPRSHCANRHELTGTNVYFTKKGGRRCLRCKRDSSRAYQRRKLEGLGIRVGEEKPAEEEKLCLGCDRPLRKQGSPRNPSTVVEIRNSGMCGSCSRYGPPTLSRELALVAVEIARDERWPVEPLEDRRTSDTSA